MRERRLRSDGWPAKTSSTRRFVRSAWRECDGSPWFVATYLRTSLRLSRQIYLSALLENLTNDTYRIHGSGVPGPDLVRT